LFSIAAFLPVILLAARWIQRQPAGLLCSVASTARHGGDHRVRVAGFDGF